jgi:hypothetical protein
MKRTLTGGKMEKKETDRKRASKNYYKWKGEVTKKKMALIARQALKIDDLEDKLKIADEKQKAIKSLLISIGAPLNDNFLQYNKSQLVIFHNIEDILDN